MIVAFTGSRPPKLGGYKLPNPVYNKVCQETERLLLELKPTLCFSGMCIGYDQYAANICIKLDIPFHAIIPFIGQEKAWPATSQKTYHTLLRKAAEKVVVCEGGYSAEKMQRRNEWMTDRCDILIAVYNGDPTGGTANCVNYARSINKQIIVIDPRI